MTKKHFQENDVDVLRDKGATNQKGREKQTLEKVIKNWDKFDEWDDAPIETFQKFNRR
jgi:hypothetical protein